MLGLWLLTSRSERWKAVLLGVVVDVPDALSWLMSWYTGNLPPSAALAAGGGAFCLVAWTKSRIGLPRMGQKSI